MVGQQERKPALWVAMSTYNGQDYVAQQLDSILAQDVADKVQLNVLVRDDGSSDGTVGILEDYEARGDIRLVRGENLGVVPSFLDLISRVPHDADFIALSDQDDVWHADKLSRALSQLQARNQDIPLLYCSEYVYCDEQLNPGERSHLNERGIDFATMLYENMVSGNTTLMNRKLADCVIRAGREGVYTHDWWLGLIATALGQLVFDDFCSLDYRRTGSNASPSGTAGLSLLRYRLQKFFAEGQFDNITYQLLRLYELFGDEMPPARRELLAHFCLDGRFKKALTPLRLRQKMRDDIALRILFLLGLL